MQPIFIFHERKNHLVLWQHLLLIVSLFIMACGVALCVRSNLGSSVIAAIPFVMTLAGEAGMAPQFTIGEYTYMMNILLSGFRFSSSAEVSHGCNFSNLLLVLFSVSY